MPLFEFRCPTCAHDFELLIRTGDRAACPECGTATVEKLFSETAPPAAAMNRSLPVASACPPGDAPCSPTCCRL
ncbi:MAG: zinc ribbon domain-containing protein [Planctomycetia bacterium]|nr:zinc ribbon domain-containing protein [Planctomycetia bacterium]